MTVNDGRMEHRPVWRSAARYLAATVGSSLVLGLALPPALAARIPPMLVVLLILIPPIALAIMQQRPMMAGRTPRSWTHPLHRVRDGRGWLISVGVFFLLRLLLPLPPA